MSIGWNCETSRKTGRHARERCRFEVDCYSRRSRIRDRDPRLDIVGGFNVGAICSRAASRKNGRFGYGDAILFERKESNRSRRSPVCSRNNSN